MVLMMLLLLKLRLLLFEDDGVDVVVDGVDDVVVAEVAVVAAVAAVVAAVGKPIDLYFLASHEEQTLQQPHSSWTLAQIHWQRYSTVPAEQLDSIVVVAVVVAAVGNAVD